MGTTSNPPTQWRLSLATSRLWLGHALIKQERHAEAAVEIDAALDGLGSLDTDEAAKQGPRHRIANAWYARALIHQTLGHDDDARKAAGTAVELYEQLAADFPDLTIFADQSKLAVAIRDELASP